MAEIIGRVGWRNYVSPISPLWNNLVAYWSGDNTANDSKGTYNGTLINGATYSTGKISNGFSLDGVNDYVNISPSLGSTFSKPSSAHSYSAWIYPTSLTGYNWIIQNGTSTTGTSMILNGANLCFFIQGGQDQTTSSATLTINTWAMVTVVYNGAGGVSFYKNGVLINSSGASWGESVATSSTYIGAINGVIHFFDGKIDEVGAWSRALTAAEVAELYNGGAGKQYVAPVPTLITSGLILNLDAGNAASYPGTGTTWTDLSGNGNNGTLINGTSYSSANSGTMVFDGINDYVGNVNNYLVSKTQQSFASNAWVKMSGNPIDSGYNVPSVINFNGNSLNYIQTMSFGLLPNRKLKLRWFDGGQQGKTGNSILNLNTWYYISCSVSNNIIKLYVNGIEETSYTGTDLTNRSEDSASWTIGNSYYGQFNGDIAQVQVYNKALTQAEITANFNALKSRYGL